MRILKYYVIQNYPSPESDSGQIIAICTTKNQAEHLFQEFYLTGREKGLTFITLDELTVDVDGRVIRQVTIKYTYVKFKGPFDTFSTA